MRHRRARSRVRGPLLVAAAALCGAGAAIAAVGLHPGPGGPVGPAQGAPRPLTSIAPSALPPAVESAYARRLVTPGSVNPAVTEATLKTTICQAGWTATVRAVSDSTKDRVKMTYGLPAGPFAGEIDHLVPLSLGGSNDASNLWPEPGSIPNPKDTVEAALQRSVCSGAMRLATAQQLIVAAYSR